VSNAIWEIVFPDWEAFQQKKSVTRIFKDGAHRIEHLAKTKVQSDRWRGQHRERQLSFSRLRSMQRPQ
jgi:hypothetical protein